MGGGAGVPPPNFENRREIPFTFLVLPNLMVLTYTYNLHGMNSKSLYKSMLTEVHYFKLK